MEKAEMDALIAQVAEADRIRLALWGQFIKGAIQVVECQYEENTKHIHGAT